MGWNSTSPSSGYQTAPRRPIPAELQFAMDRSLYHQSAEECQRVLLGLAGARNISIEDKKAVGEALSWFAKGMDFADALHLAASAHTEGLCTFDKKLGQVAGRVGAGKVIELPAAGA